MIVFIANDWTADKYSNTVNLPKTSFDMRANSTVKEPQLQAFWKENRVYEKLSRENSGVRKVGNPFCVVLARLGCMVNTPRMDKQNLSVPPGCLHST